MSALRRVSLIQGPPGPPGTVQGVPAAWTPGLIHTGAFASLVVPVTGAVLGFAALPAWSVALPDGVFLTAQVTSGGSTKVYMWNFSGSDQTIAAGNVYVECLVQ